MNKLIKLRLSSIHSVLCSAFEAGRLLSSASKGYEREAFIKLFLSEVLPSIYRFGTGDITDSSDNGSNIRSGQIDIVIEMPWAPSFPMPVGDGTRLYPSEAVGTAIEVKSNITNQWNDVVSTANLLKPLRQKLSGISVEKATLRIETETEEPIPFYAVGFDGWKKKSTVIEKAKCAEIDGILVLKHKIFVHTDRRQYYQRLSRCEEELTKKNQGNPFSMTSATCARIVELLDKISNPIDIVKKINSEKLEVNSVHFGDQQFLPEVKAATWTEQDLQEFCKVFQLKTYVSEGDEALLKFIATIHNEVGKRSAMSVDLLNYA